MGTNIHGWVEVNTINESTENIWFRVIEIDILVERNYEVYGSLFGIRAKNDVVPIAPNRGLPNDLPEYYAQELKGKSMVGVTWASFEEIREHLAKLCENQWLRGWKFILNSMDELQMRFGKGNVRIVVGFDNYG